MNNEHENMVDKLARLEVYENCYFCKLQTDMWHEETNTPVCPHCADNHSENELPGAKILARPKIKPDNTIVP